VRQGFLKLAKEAGGRILVVDAGCKIEELFEKIRGVMEQKLEEWR